MTYSEVDSEDSFTKREKCYVKKQREEHRHRMKTLKQREYQNLRIMVPAIASMPNVSKVTVIEEAVRYIDHLHVTLLEKLEEKDRKCLSDGDGSAGAQCSAKNDFFQSIPKALELVKKADYLLYSKLSEQMKAFATKKACVAKNLGSEDDSEGEMMAKELMDFSLE